ncbi:GntR family transcriptional regulator [Clostridiaceae bacterium M8S5]|nr:GntR family transcriptional regulator [Clostridiaceae bacterium M8S5]
MKTVSRQNPLPLYYQLKELLNEMIDNDLYKPGDNIPPERELCQMYNVSRMTARRAVMALVNEGVLYREQGKGTFVSEPKKRHNIFQLKGFTEQMEEKGLKTNTKELSFKIVDTTNKIKKALEIKDDEKVFEIKRLRMVEGEPFLIETVYIPFNLCSDLTEEMLLNKSLYQIFKERYDFVFSHAKQTIEPIKVNEYESELLNIDEESMQLLFTGITYLEAGRPIEYVRAIYRSDRYKYEVTLKA